MSHVFKELVTAINQHAGSAPVTASFIAAGFVPNVFSLNSFLQLAYFCVVLPPAAYHLWLWIKTVWDQWRNKQNKD